MNKGDRLHYNFLFEFHCTSSKISVFLLFRVFTFLTINKKSSFISSKLYTNLLYFVIILISVFLYVKKCIPKFVNICKFQNGIKYNILNWTTIFSWVYKCCKAKKKPESNIDIRPRKHFPCSFDHLYIVVSNDKTIKILLFSFHLQKVVRNSSYSYSTWIYALENIFPVIFPHRENSDVLI